jgi:hypothetical protein
MREALGFLTSDRQVISKAPRQQIPHTAPAAISRAPQCTICSGDGICAADQSLRNIKPISSISATHRRENPPFGLRAKKERVTTSNRRQLGLGEHWSRRSRNTWSWAAPSHYQVGFDPSPRSCGRRHRFYEVALLVLWAQLERGTAGLSLPLGVTTARQNRKPTKPEVSWCLSSTFVTAALASRPSRLRGARE